MAYCKNCGNELLADAKFCPKCGAPLELTQSLSTQAASVVPSGITLAHWGERFVAWLVDIVIIGIFVGVLGVFAWFATGNFTW